MSSITQYSLYCQKENNTTSEVNTSSGKKLHFQLTGLSGVYLIYMSAHTEEGEGRASLLMWVTVEDKYSDHAGLCPPSGVHGGFAPDHNCMQAKTSFHWLIRATLIKQNIRPPAPDTALSSLNTWRSDSECTTKKFYSEGVIHTSCYK